MTNFLLGHQSNCILETDAQTVIFSLKLYTQRNLLLSLLMSLQIFTESTLAETQKIKQSPERFHLTKPFNHAEKLNKLTKHSNLNSISKMQLHFILLYKMDHFLLVAFLLLFLFGMHMLLLMDCMHRHENVQSASFYSKSNCRCFLWLFYNEM